MNKSPSNSKDAFAKATSPQEPKPTKQAETEQIKFVSDPMSFTIHGTHGGKSKVVIEDQDGTLEAEFIPEKAQKPPLNLNTDDITLDWQEEGYAPSQNGVLRSKRGSAWLWGVRWLHCGNWTDSQCQPSACDQRPAP